MRCTRFLSGTLLFSKVLLGCFMLAGLAGCNSLKKVPENQSLLVKNKVKVSSGGTIDKNDLSSALAQEPNSKILGGRLKLSFYNWSKDEKDNWWNNKLRDIGEKPVIFDSTAIQSSAERILSMASAKGYLHPVLETEVTRKGREKRKVVVSYRLQLDEPYHIRHTQIDIQDDSLRPELADWEKEALVQPGMQYDVSLLDAERARISEKLQNNGYWAFNKDFLHYSIDSNLNSKQMDVILHVRKMVSNMVDSLTGEPILLHHKKYYLDQVYIIPLSRNQAQADTFRFDTVAFEEISRREKRKGKSGPVYHILNQGKPIIKYKSVVQKTILKPGDLYSLKNVTDTYDNLSDLRAFQYTNISLSEKPYDTCLDYAQNNRLDCQIRMIQGSRFSFSVEGQLTTSSGIQGVAANFGFQNRNTFGGGEILNIRLGGAYEFQFTVDNNRNRTFLNTFEASLDASLEFPRFLLPGRMDRINKNARPSTVISAGYSYQHKKDYSRSIFNANFAYRWEKDNWEHSFSPLEISTIQMIQTSESFQSILDEYEATQNYRLYYQYTDHFIMTPRYQFIYTDQQSGVIKDFNHLRFEVEAAGNLLYGIAMGIHGEKPQAAGYELFGLPFSQYIRAEADYSHHFVFGLKTDLVVRAGMGIGYSYGNSQSLPYEKGFFIGGNSTIRAWPLYQLGPGSYLHPEDTPDFERLGDVFMVFNIEQRFPIWGGLMGAVFLDAGNIWLVRPNEAYPNGEFHWNKFYKDFALGTGFGLRYDFKFFIIRMDIGIPLRDPSLQGNGDTWVIKQLRLRDMLFNFGIGYPF